MTASRYPELKNPRQARQLIDRLRGPARSRRALDLLANAVYSRWPDNIALGTRLAVRFWEMQCFPQALSVLEYACEHHPRGHEREGKKPRICQSV